MRIDNYRTIIKNGKRVKEHSYTNFPSLKSIVPKGYKRKRKSNRSHGYSGKVGIVETVLLFISLIGTGLLSFYITFGLFLDFFLNKNGIFGGLLILIFIGFLLHLLLLLLVLGVGYSIGESISSTGQPSVKKHVVKNSPNNIDHFDHVKLSNETKIRLEIEWAEWQKKRGLLK